MKRALLASGLALLGTALAYGALGMAAGLAGGWTWEIGPSQALGLALHAAVVFLRGLLPAVLLTSLAGALLAQRAGRPLGWRATLAIAGVVAAVVFSGLLTLPLGDWPRLQVTRAVDAVASVVALALASAAAVGLARRLVPLRGAARPSPG